MKKKLLMLFAAMLIAVGAWAQNEDMLNTPLTLEAIEAGTIKFNNRAKGQVTYRVNGGKVQTIESKNVGKIVIRAGDKVEFFGDNSSYFPKDYSSTGTQIDCSGDCYIYGNIMSLVTSTNYATADRLESKYTFCLLFYFNRHLKNHPLNQLMLPATTLTESCYENMFMYCLSLTKASELPATKLSKNCYTGMFNGCAGLTEASELPATTLAEGCYNKMIFQCKELTKAPKLPAITLVKSCYEDMFYDCSGLTEAPDLPAMALAESCYEEMFYRCTGLAKAPALPAMALAGACYVNMFNGCTGLTEAPELPATTLASYCYCDMFYGCTGLTEAPELPATMLAEGCYIRMFNGCTGLTEAPALPATTLANNCYYSMFKGCTNLSSVTCLATDISARYTTSDWLKDVSSTGTFYKHPDMKDWPVGVSGIPSSWTIVDYDMTGINATTAGAKKALATTYDLRGMKSAAGKKGLKIVGDKKILTR